MVWFDDRYVFGNWAAADGLFRTCGGKPSKSDQQDKKPAEGLFHGLVSPRRKLPFIFICPYKPRIIQFTTVIIGSSSKSFAPITGSTSHPLPPPNGPNGKCGAAGGRIMAALRSRIQ